MIRFFFRLITNSAALLVAEHYLPGFQIAAGWKYLLLAAFVLALLNTFVRPVLRLVFKPLVWITFGFFNLIINAGILWIADQLLTSLTIDKLATLFWASILIALANIF